MAGLVPPTATGEAPEGDKYQVQRATIIKTVGKHQVKMEIDLHQRRKNIVFLVLPPLLSATGP